MGSFYMQIRRIRPLSYHDKYTNQWLLGKTYSNSSETTIVELAKIATQSYSSKTT